MYEKAKSAFIPAALACIGVEHAPGALPCQAGVSDNKACNPYDIKFINTQTSKKETKKEVKQPKSESLYKRTATTQNSDFVSRPDIVNEKASIELSTADKTDISRQVEAKAQHTTIKKDEKLKTDSKISTHKPEKKLQTNKKVITKAKDIDIPVINNKKSELTKKSLTSKVVNKSLDNYTYVISKGDTLAKLALKFNTSVSNLLKINNLKDSDAIKVGQKLLIPKNNLKITDKKIKKSIYIVEKGDTLAKISKLTGISVAKLIKYNNLSGHQIKVGQKIYLRANNLKKSKTIAKKRVKKGVLKPTRQLRVTATAYTSHSNQTDKTPFLAAWNNRIRPGMKIIAVSRDLIEKYGLTNGVKVKIKGLPGYYTVRDKMNKRFKRKIDIYMGLNKRKALKWGKRKIVLMW